MATWCVIQDGNQLRTSWFDEEDFVPRINEKVPDGLLANPGESYVLYVFSPLTQKRLNLLLDLFLNFVGSADGLYDMANELMRSGIDIAYHFPGRLPGYELPPNKGE